MQRVIWRAQRAPLGPSFARPAGLAGLARAAPGSPLGASRVHVAGGQAASASSSPLFNDNGFTASLHIGVILYKQG